MAGRCAERAWIWRDPRIGNYTRGSGRPASAHAPSYTGWSDLENHFFPKRLWFLGAFFAVFLGVCSWELRHGLGTRTGRTALLCLTVAGSTMLAFAVLVVAGGIEDAIVDLNQFLVLFDVCLVCAMAWAGTRLALLFAPRRHDAHLRRRVPESGESSPRLRTHPQRVQLDIEFEPARPQKKHYRCG